MPLSAPWMIRWSYVLVMVSVRPIPAMAMVRGSAPSYSGGKPMRPTPTITPWPGIRRGTDWTVPIVPGLVRVAVVPAKSSGVTLPDRTLATTSS